jgi:hypothetical protein
VNGCSDPVLVSWSAISLLTISSWPGIHIGLTLLCSASWMRDWWQSQTSYELDYLIECRCPHFYTFSLDSQLRIT